MRQKGQDQPINFLQPSCLPKKLTNSSSHDQNGAIGLTRARDHVLDEISMSGSIDNGHVVLWSLEFPKRYVDGYSALALGLELVEDPGVLEAALAHFLGLLLEFFDRALVYATAFVDQVTGRGRLSRIHVTYYHDVYVDLLLPHVALLLAKLYSKNFESTSFINIYLFFIYYDFF